MRKIYLLLLTVCVAAMANSQVTVNVTNPTNTTPNLAASYGSLALALTDLNAVTAMTGPVTLTCVAGAETAPTAAGFTIGSATLNPVLSATNTVTINTSGGAVTLDAAAGGIGTPASAVQDGILKLVGADYITIDGLTLVDGNAANPATMEFGIGLFKLSLSDGAQNNTIQNCIITLNRINNASGSGPSVEGSRGINVVNATEIAQITSLTPVTAAGTNSNNRFYSNSIGNCNYGIALNGFAAATPFTAGDTGNDIGGAGAGTGNTILNYGGAPAATNPAAGIRANNQWGINISYNTVDNNNGSGVNHVSTLRGIFAQAGTSANATITNNTVTVQSGATTSALIAIDNGIGSTAASNTVTISNNIVQNCTYSTSTSGTFTGIQNTASAATIIINGNTVTNNLIGGTGTNSMILSSATTAGTLTINSNTITNNNRSSATSGTQRGISFGSPTTGTIDGNTVDGMSFTTAASTGNIDGIYGLSSSVNMTITNNIVRNLSTPATGTINGIREFGVTGTKTIQNNQVYNLSTTAGGAGGATFNGIFCSTGNIGISNNLIYSLNSTGSTGGTGGVISGVQISGGTSSNIFKNKIYDLSTTSTTSTIVSVNGILMTGNTSNTVHNNLVGDLRATASAFTDAIRGISSTVTSSTSTVNIYFNTVYLNASSSGANFGTSGIFHTASTTATTAALSLRNNNIVNLSTPAGTGLTVAYRRSSGAVNTLNNYASTSNNNLFYAGTPGVSNLIYADGTSTAQTLAAYKAGVFTAGTIAPRDGSSVTENPPFLSTVGANANFLHIDPSVATQVESGATAIAGITDDFDGDVRNVSTPDIGADEGTFILADITGPSISYTPLPFTCATGNRTLTASITDPSGVPVAGAGLPVLYWAINAGAYTAATGTFVSGSNYDFVFGAGAITGDVVSYYIVAQDNAGTPNVGSFPSAGAAGFTINPPAAATPPTTPSSYIINITLSGTKTVGIGGDYTTLTAAVAAYNTSCLSGPVVFSLTDATYPSETFPITINSNAEAGTNTLTIKPTLAATTISGSSASGIFILNGADYIIIDGSITNTANTVCPASAASRDLTITNTNTGTSSAVVWLQSTGANGATNNGIRNCNLTGNGVTQTLFGAGAGSSTISISSLGTGNNNNSYINNNISGVQYGIYTQGASAASKNTGTVINQNLINTSANTKGGIWVGFENSVTISGNSISNIAQTSSPDVFGITCGFGTSMSATTSAGNEVTNATITNNVIGSVVNSGTFSAYGIGVASATTGTTLIANNMISGVAANGTSGDFGAGIVLGGGTGSTANVYYNTVSMQGTITGGTSATQTSACIAVTNSTQPVLDFRNNIFTNTQIGNTGATLRFASVALGYSTFTTLTSDNNDLYCAGAGPGTYQVGITGTVVGGTNSTTLANWQTTTTQDANSKNALPSFFTATNLHLVSPDASNFNNFESMGVAVSVTNDIDCETRPNGTAPDIGADEFVGVIPSLDVSAQAITGIPVSLCPNNSVPLSVTVKNETATTLDFSANNMSIALNITGASTQTLNFSITSGTLGAGVSQSYLLAPNADLSANGTHNLSAVITLAGEINIANNTVNASKIINGSAPVSLPQTVSFTGYTGANLTTVFPNWNEAVGAALPSGTTSAWTSQATWAPADTTIKINLFTTTRNEWIVGPKFVATAASELRFDAAITDFASVAADPSGMQGTDDRVVVKISTDCGGTYSDLFTFNAANTVTLTNVQTPQVINLSAYAGQSVIIAFFATDGPTDDAPDYDFHIDDINILNVFPIDAGATTLALPATSGCYGPAETVTVTVKNYGTTTLDFSVTPITVTTNVTGAAIAALSGTLSTGTLAPNATVNVPMSTTLNMTAPGTYTFNAFTTLAGDGFAGNDAMAPVNRTPALLAGGTYPVGAGQSGFGGYNTLTDAVAAYNAASCITGPIVFSLTDATYSGSETFPITINHNGAASAINTLTIHPATGVTAAISGSNAVTILKVNGGDYVTIDGSNNGSSSRDLTITNTGTGAIVWIGTGATGGATNNTLKNFNMVGPGAFGGQGIIAGSGTTFGSAAENGRPNSDNTVQNTTAKGVQNGIFALGDPTTLDANWVITQNEFGSTVVAEKLSFRGIALQNAQNFTISLNKVIGVNSSTSTSATMSGILVGATLNGGVITRNELRDIKQNNTTGWGSNGIFLNSSSAATSVAVTNNFISDVASQGFNGQDQADNGYGIMVAAGGGYTVYYNTVLMNTEQVATDGQPAAINIESAVPAGGVNIRNNIFVTTQTIGTNYAVIHQGTNATFAAINYNDYVSTEHIGFLTSNQTTLTNWQTATGQDANSITVAPVFVSATDLHLVPASNCSLHRRGTPIAGITTDYDNDTRHATLPDIGADEYTINVAGAILWTGAVSTDWFDVGNWNLCEIPGPTSDVVVNGALPNYPVVNANVIIKSLTLNTGATVTVVTGFDIMLLGN